MKKLFVILAAPFVLLAVLLSAHYFAGRPRQQSLMKVPDHGVWFTFEAPDGQGIHTGAELKHTLEKRFAFLGVRILWEPVSQTQFRLCAPLFDQSALETAAGMVTNRGVLQFRLVRSDKPELLSAAEEYEPLEVKSPAGPADGRVQRYLVSRRVEGGPSGIKVRQAAAKRNSSTGTYDIFFKLEPDSSEAFRKITGENVGRQLGIVMDNVLLAAPVIRGEIALGSGVISGNFDEATANQLAALMETPLPVALKLLETKIF